MIRLDGWSETALAGAFQALAQINAITSHETTRIDAQVAMHDVVAEFVRRGLTAPVPAAEGPLALSVLRVLEDQAIRRGRKCSSEESGLGIGYDTDCSCGWHILTDSVNAGLDSLIRHICMEV